MPGRGTARVYIDGFNLYYGALKGTPLKWLDLEALCAVMLPTYDIDRIVYCTARVAARPENPSVHVRQDAYLRALATLATVEVLEGQFKSGPTRMPRVPLATCDCCSGARAACACCHSRTVKVMKTEEKGSDVNLAVELVRDGFKGYFDIALVISDDSDLQPAVDIVRGELGKRVIVADPRNRKHPSLRGDERRQVRTAALGKAQLPAAIRESSGRMISKPAGW
jgi:uncharacterized LabA/DUF88 family protein